ncbi:MAG TPA: MBL fold metallo-hydrolase [Thermoleophilaceae bacterium]|nr:MBL fold metallo-hydrolase [Thermoleophilaceae bacterium]
MIVRRLGWAGIEVEAEGATLLIDHVEDVSGLEPFVGPPHGPLPAPSRTGAVGALVTHLHADHCDAGALARALAAGAPVLRPEPAQGGGLETAALTEAEQGIERQGLAAHAVAPWERARLGPFTVTALPAVDGFGDPQVSWAVEAGGHRILHAGDTLFHGFWWLSRMRAGPFDAVFLPVNGAVVDLPHRQPPSPLGADMDPEQAALAASLLQAGLAVPIHYDTLDGPPVYTQVDDPVGRFVAACDAAGVESRVLATGDSLDLTRRPERTP